MWSFLKIKKKTAQVVGEHRQQQGSKPKDALLLLNKPPSFELDEGLGSDYGSCGDLEVGEQQFCPNTNTKKQKELSRGVITLIVGFALLVLGVGGYVGCMFFDSRGQVEIAPEQGIGTDTTLSGCYFKKTVSLFFSCC